MTRARDLEWAAGFLEGEGCFKGGKGTQHVQVLQVNPDPLQRLVGLFGGHVSLRVRTGKHHSIHQWEITGSRARGVMLTLYGLLSHRRRVQIRKALLKGDLSPGHFQRRQAKAWITRRKRYGPRGQRPMTEAKTLVEMYERVKPIL